MGKFVTHLRIGSLVVFGDAFGFVCQEMIVFGANVNVQPWQPRRTPAHAPNTSETCAFFMSNVSL